MKVDRAALERFIDELIRPYGMRVAGNGIKINPNYQGLNVRIWPTRYGSFDIPEDEVEGPLDLVCERISKRVDDVVVRCVADLLRSLPEGMQAKAIRLATEITT